MKLSTRIFDDYLPAFGTQAFAPLAPNATLKVDIAESDKGYTVTADVPGYAKEDLGIEFSDGVLVLEARTENEKTATSDKDKDKQADQAKLTYVFKERRLGKQVRSFRFADDVDGKKIDAKLADGVLEVFVPKATSRKQRQIEIK